MTEQMNDAFQEIIDDIDRQEVRDISQSNQPPQVVVDVFVLLAIVLAKRKLEWTQLQKSIPLMIDEMDNLDIESVSALTLKKMKNQIENTQVSDIQYIRSASRATACVAEWLMGVFDYLTKDNESDQRLYEYEEETIEQVPQSSSYMTIQANRYQPAELSPKRIAQNIASSMTEYQTEDSQTRLWRMREQRGYTEDQELETASVLNRSIMDVKKNAIAQQVVRVSPKKLYGGVKSKIAGNMRSIERAQREMTYSNPFRTYDTLNPERFQNQYVSSVTPDQRKYSKSVVFQEPHQDQVVRYSNHNQEARVEIKRKQSEAAALEQKFADQQRLIKTQQEFEAQKRQEVYNQKIQEYQRLEAKEQAERIHSDAFQRQMQEQERSRQERERQREEAFARIEATRPQAAKQNYKQNEDMADDQSKMDQIIEKIKNKFTQNYLKNMSQSEILQEVLIEMEKNQEEDAEDKFVRENEQIEEPEFSDQQDPFVKYDRSQQMATSSNYEELNSMQQKKSNFIDQKAMFYKQLNNVSPYKPSQQISKSYIKVSPSKFTQSQLIDDLQQSYVMSKSVAQVSRGKRQKSQDSPTRANIISGYEASAPNLRVDSELNRAVARSKYVDASVNVVSQKGSTGKYRKDAVKPGQMNLFNPSEMKGVTLEAHNMSDIFDDIPQPNDTSPKRQQNISQIRNIMADEGGQGKIRNNRLQQKTQNVQNEFETLMNEMVNRRITGKSTDIVGSLATAEFLQDGYYQTGPQRKHKSPTRRLIQHKNSTWDHKEKIQNTIEKGRYSQTYCIAPGKSYVIEAQGGELSYDMAKKRPRKFYDQLLNQDKKKYSVSMRGKIKGEMTQNEKKNLLMAKAMSYEINADSGAAVNISVNSPTVQRFQKPSCIM